MPLELNFDRLPALLPRYLRALVHRRKDLSGALQIPQIHAVVPGVVADPKRVAAFCGLLEHPGDGNLPPTFPQVLATPLHLAILTAPEFPLRAPGLVHMSNDISVVKPIPVTAKIRLAASLTDPEQTARGFEMTMRTSAAIDGEVIWSSCSRFFARRSGRGKGAPVPRSLPEGQVELDSWQAAANIGRRYASVSGDYNPIHLSALTARPFGFRAAIAHGMWSFGRTMAALHERLLPPYVFSAQFRRPLLLPAQLRLMHGDDSQFSLVDGASGKAYLAGSYGQFSQ